MNRIRKIMFLACTIAIVGSASARAWAETQTVKLEVLTAVPIKNATNNSYPISFHISNSSNVPVAKCTSSPASIAPNATQTFSYHCPTPGKVGIPLPDAQVIVMVGSGPDYKNGTNQMLASYLPYFKEWYSGGCTITMSTWAGSGSEIDCGVGSINN